MVFSEAAETEEIKVIWTLSIQFFSCVWLSVSDKWLSETREPGTWYCERHCCRILPPRLLGYLWGANRVQMGFLSWSFLICMSEPSKATKKLNSDVRIQEIVQFALCSEPLNPTRQKAQRVLVVEHLVIHLTSLTCYLVCASNNIHTKQKRTNMKIQTDGVEQYKELFHMLPAN